MTETRNAETQSAQSQSARPLPAAPFLKIPEEGSPYLEGFRCAKCAEVFLADHPACAACRARGSLKPYRLADTGKLYNFTVVHRNFPGVAVPFISAIVDLDGGGSVKGNLVDIVPSPEALKFDMPVKVVYRDAGRKDKDGHSYLAYFFTPAA
ncbi:MAG TPA: OB-fold domain-containing protein [Caulobacteraceae bacterium]|nr:OB-fold domain-containing protein [Caulobacteraceae bacterium]